MYICNICNIYIYTLTYTYTCMYIYIYIPALNHIIFHHIPLYPTLWRFPSMEDPQITMGFNTKML